MLETGLTVVYANNELVSLNSVVITLARHNLPPTELSPPAPAYSAPTQTPTRDPIQLEAVPRSELVDGRLLPGQ